MGGSGLARAAHALQQGGERGAQAPPPRAGVPLGRWSRNDGTLSFERTDAAGSGNARCFHAMLAEKRAAPARKGRRARAAHAEAAQQRAESLIMPTAAAVGVAGVLGIGTSTAAAAPMAPMFIPLGMAATAVAFAAI